MLLKIVSELTSEAKFQLGRAKSGFVQKQCKCCFSYREFKLLTAQTGNCLTNYIQGEAITNRKLLFSSDNF